MVTIRLHQTTTATPEQFLVLGKALATTVKAIEARNHQPRQAQS
jgi:hypothetical protein